MIVQANLYGYAGHQLDDHDSSFCLKMHSSPELSLLWQARIVPCARSALRSLFKVPSKFLLATYAEIL